MEIEVNTHGKLKHNPHAMCVYVCVYLCSVCIIYICMCVCIFFMSLCMFVCASNISISIRNRIATHFPVVVFHSK